MANKPWKFSDYKKNVIRLEASAGCKFIVKYKGRWIRMEPGTAYDFHVKGLAYLAKLEIERAIDSEHIEVSSREISVPALGKQDKALADLKAKRLAAQKNFKKPDPAKSAAVPAEKAEAAKES